MAFELLTSLPGLSFYLTDESPPTFTAPQAAIAVFRDPATDAVAIYQSQDGTNWRMYFPGAIPSAAFSAAVPILARTVVPTAGGTLEVTLPSKVTGAGLSGWRVARAWLISDAVGGTVEIRASSGGPAVMTLTPGAVGTVIQNADSTGETGLGFGDTVYVVGSGAITGSTPVFLLLI